MEDGSARQIALTIAGVLSTALIASGTPSSSEDSDVVAGRRLAAEHCSRCHAIAGPGPSPVSAAPPFSSFGRKWPVEFLAEALAEGIAVGHRGVIEMPEFVFSPEEISDLLAFLASVQQ